MHMWMWFGYNFGEFMFPGLSVAKKTEFAITCVVLFIISFLFEGSKVYVARTQRKAVRRLYPHRQNDERRNLLWDTTLEIRDAGPSSRSRRVHVDPVSTKRKILMNLYQTSLFLLHNVFGYLLMLAVMLYNVYVLVVVVLGMIAGYFVFGPMLTRMQMECFAKEGAGCTDRCDDNAEATSPPLLPSPSSDSGLLACQTPSCTCPGDSAATTSQVSARRSSCRGARHCPSKVAVVERLHKKQADSHCHHTEHIKNKELQNLEDVILLREDSRVCCASTPPPVALDPVVSVLPADIPREQSPHTATPAHELTTERNSRSQRKHGQSPQITCCHSNMKHSDS